MTVTGSREALKPCPFCGVSPCQIPQNDDCRLPDMSGYYQTICCENCGAEGGKRKTGEAATEAWNTRASPDPAGETLTVEESARIINPLAWDETYWMTGRIREKTNARVRAATILSLLKSRSVQSSIATKRATDATGASASETTTGYDVIARLFELPVRDMGGGLRIVSLGSSYLPVAERDLIVKAVKFYLDRPHG